ncbi:MAG: tetratricopeptide repeat protein, partial [Planctomycetota bacterium]
GLELFIKILDALDYAHHQGIIHRDIKPSNIFITAEGFPKIGDFGISKTIQDSKLASPLSIEGEILGTPIYMAPEQIVGQATLQSDLYSVGVCLFQFLTGHCPFENESLKRLFYQIITEDVLPPSHWKPKISRDLDAILLKALEKNQEKRYSSARTFARDLEHYLKGLPVLARPISRVERLLKWGRRNPQIVLVACVLFFLCFSTWIYFLRKQHQDIDTQVKTLVSQMQQEKKQAQHLLNTGETEKMFQALLRALNLLNLALAISPKDSRIDQEKKIIVKDLVRLACDYREYEMAQYLLRDLREISTHPATSLREYQELESFVKESKTRVLTQHQQTLTYWFERLKSKEVELREREKALFDIAKMTEPEIFEGLQKKIQEGAAYFLQQHPHSRILEKYYETLTLAWGRQGNPQVAPVLFSTLERLFAKVSENLQAETASSDIEYMIALAQALSYSNASGYARKLEEIRFQMGQTSLFWLRTNLAYRKLSRLDRLALEKISDTDSLFHRARARHDQGDWKGALEDYTEVIQMTPASASGAYNGRALVKSSRGDFSGAIADFTEAIRIAPQADFYCNRGVTYYDLQRYKDSVNDLTVALKLDPDLPSAYSNRAVSRRYLGDLNGSIEDCTQAIRLNPQYINAYLNRGVAWKSKGDLEAARKDFQKTIDLDPKFGEGYFHRGIIKKALGDLNGALEDQTLAIQLNPSSAKAYLNRGITKATKGDLNGAIQDYTEGIRLEPSLADAYQIRGLAKLMLKDDSGALADFSEAIRFDPKSIPSYTNRGSVYFNQKQYQKAIEDYTRAIQLDSQQIEAYFNRALAEVSSGQQEKAETDIQIVIGLMANQKDPNIQKSLGKMMQLFPDLGKKIRQLIKQSQDYLSQGNEKQSQGNWAGAIHDYDQALELNPYFFSSYYQKALVYEKWGKDDLAINTLQQGLQLQQEEQLRTLLLDILFRKGILAYQQAQYPESKALLKLFQHYAPNPHPNLSRVLETLKSIESQE